MLDVAVAKGATVGAVVATTEAIGVAVEVAAELEAAPLAFDPTSKARFGFAGLPILVDMQYFPRSPFRTDFSWAVTESDQRYLTAIHDSTYRQS
jgi:hypothetical protein